MTATPYIQHGLAMQAATKNIAAKVTAQKAAFAAAYKAKRKAEVEALAKAQLATWKKINPVWTANRPGQGTQSVKVDVKGKAGEAFQAPPKPSPYVNAIEGGSALEPRGGTAVSTRAGAIYEQTAPMIEVSHAAPAPVKAAVAAKTAASTAAAQKSAAVKEQQAAAHTSKEAGWVPWVVVAGVGYLLLRS